MKLKSFGCSFIFGTDLHDDGRNLIVPTASNHTWPAYLAQHFGFDYECQARPGSGNLQIAERVLSSLTELDSSFYVIGWTWIDRFDYTNSNVSNDPIQSKWKNWRTLMPVDTTDLAKTYYRGLHSEYRDKLCSLMYIKLVIDTLQQQGKSFLMTYQDDLLLDAGWNCTPAVLELQNFVKPHMSTFDGKTFYHWSKNQGYEISPTLHPLEQAHRAAADYIIKLFDKQKIVDPAQQVHV